MWDGGQEATALLGMSLGAKISIKEKGEWLHPSELQEEHESDQGG